TQMLLDAGACCCLPSPRRPSPASFSPRRTPVLSHPGGGTLDPLVVWIGGGTRRLRRQAVWPGVAGRRPNPSCSPACRVATQRDVLLHLTQRTWAAHTYVGTE